MKPTNLFIILCISVYGVINLDCNKTGFLDKKPTTGLTIPQTLEDLQKLLDNTGIPINGCSNLGEASSDDYYMFDFASWQLLPTYYRNAYIWKPDLYEGMGNIQDWAYPFTQIFYANIVLEQVDKVEVNSINEAQWKMIRGWALFIRGYAYHNLATLFAPPYDEATAGTDLGIPIRLDPDVSVVYQRASVRDTYNQIITDLMQARDLLPNTIQSPNRNRPYKSAATALLARVYLNMRKYDKALDYANESLQLYNTLMDFNGKSSFTRTEAEVLFQAEMGLGAPPFRRLGDGNTIIDTILWNMYSANDLRKSLYFRVVSGKVNRNFSYSGTINAFGGMATDEVYLIKAECLARANDVSGAIDLLNQVLVKRYVTNTFVPLAAANQQEALNLVLTERRKELCFRGLRWQDLRRLNKEGANISLRRILNGQTYMLTPNSPLWVLPIPQDEIRLSGIQQNNR